MHAYRFIPLLLVVFATLPSSAATYTVTSGADSGPGTLRQAILDANANPGLDQIRFTTDVLVDPPSLPAITDVVNIDGLQGSSQTRITAAALVDGFRAFRFAPGSSGSTLRNVWVRAFVESLRIDSGVTGVTAEDNRLENAMSINGSSNLIQENTRIGVMRVAGPGNDILGNGAVQITLVGGSTGSRVAGNTVTGDIRVSSTATGVEISQNSVTGGQPVDLNADGPTPNDPPPDADTGGNNLQNYPVLTSAVVQGGLLTVTGTLASAPSTGYRIELFSNPAADPAMRTYLGAFDVTTDATGNVAFTRTINPASVPAEGEVITATATSTATADTSEVSAPATVTVQAVAFTPVPTLSPWALLALAGALMAIVLLRLR